MSNLRDFIDRTKDVTLEEKLHEHRYAIFVAFLITMDFLVTLSVINHAIVSPIYSQGLIIEHPRVDVVLIKYGVLLKSILMYGVAVGFTRRIPDDSAPGGPAE